MGDAEIEFARLKAETLDLLGANGEHWMEFHEISCVHEECDGEVDEVALREAVNDLVSEGLAEYDPARDEYRWAAPQEGESLADKVKRLEAERDAALAHAQEARAAVAELLVECRERAVHDDRQLDELRGLRAEQAADRAAVRALAEALPKTGHRSLGIRAEFSALQTLMATWPSDADPGDRVPLSSETHRWGHAPGCLWCVKSREWGCVPGCPTMETAEYAADSEESPCAGPCCGGYGYDEESR